MPDSNIIPIRAVQTLGITSTAILSGLCLSVSTLLTPRLLESPAPLLRKQWKNLYLAGRSRIAPLAGFSALTWWFLAYKVYKVYKVTNLLPEQQRSKMYAYVAAGVMCIGFVPYTIIAMGTVNKNLMEEANKVEALNALGGDPIAEIDCETGPSIHELLDRWAMLNLGRFVLGVSATILGTWTALA